MTSPQWLDNSIAIVDKVVALCNELNHDIAGQIEEAGEQVRSIACYLQLLDSKLEAYERTSALLPDDINDLLGVLSRIEKDVQRIEEILLKWRDGPALHSLTKSDLVCQKLIRIGCSPGELEGISKKLDEHMDEIGRCIQFLQAAAMNAQFDGQGQRSSKSAQRSARSWPRSHVSILFVSTDGEGRASVAEAYAKLLEGWTVSTGYHWPLNHIRSSGLYNKAYSDTVVLQENLQMSMCHGDKLPNIVAQSALFNELHFNYPDKDEVKQEISCQSTRGLVSTAFSDYDYILCFTRMHAANLERMKDFLRSQQMQTPSNDRGQILLLGAYGNSHITKEILRPKENPDGTESFNNWATTVERIKFSLKAFLKTELGWVEPPPGALQLL